MKLVVEFQLHNGRSRLRVECRDTPGQSCSQHDGQTAEGLAFRTVGSSGLDELEKLG